MKHPGFKNIVMYIVIPLIILVVTNHVFQSPRNLEFESAKATDNAIKEFLPELKNSIDKFISYNKGLVPANVQTMIDSGELKVDVYNNGYRNEIIKQVPFGSEYAPGNYSYIPVEVDGELRAYYLIGHGSNMNSVGADINNDGRYDYIILVLKGPDNPDLQARLPDWVDLIQIDQ